MKDIRVCYIIGLWLVNKTWAEMKPNIPKGGILYPHASQIREVISLDGVWNFILDSKDQLGIPQMWFNKNIELMEGAMLMPVPSSYNDITTLASVRDHIGMVWYDRKFYVPNSWSTQNFRVWLRFGSVNYFAHVWVNGKKVMEHEIGHLPFREEITEIVYFGEENKLTVAVDNILGPETVPQGYMDQVNTTEGPKRVQYYTFDFFNYAGIHRSVHVYTTPFVYIDDIDLTTEIKDSKAFVIYKLFFKGYSNTDIINSTLSVINKDGHLECFQKCNIENGTGNIRGSVEVERPKFWWPYLMDSKPGYLYTIEIKLDSLERRTTDVYRLSYGLRTIKSDNNSIYINAKPFYIRGFGKHEDSNIRGRGLDLPTAVKDHNLLKWIGANAYRTSHYPYAEETMDLADSQGIMIIEESPSTGTENFPNILLEKHKVAITEMVNRDKNRACVIMWSVANEPKSEKLGASTYFGSLVGFLRTLDGSRPITAMINRWHMADQVGQFLDVICFNRYWGWYTNTGHLTSIQLHLETEALEWRKKYLKPVIMSEFGGEAYEGLHSLPDYMWSEEYHQSLLSEHFKAFDNLRDKGWFIGEMIWNFADVKTEQSFKRVGGNKKGIFTRERQPKSAAFLVRERYFQLASVLDGAKFPDDLYRYTSINRKLQGH